jgi:hypothetical protein
MSAIETWNQLAQSQIASATKDDKIKCFKHEG